MLTVSGLADGYTIIFVASTVSGDPCAVAFNLASYQGGLVTNGEVTINLPSPATYQSCVGLSPTSKDELSVSTATLHVTYQQVASTATNELQVVLLPTLTFVILAII